MATDDERREVAEKLRASIPGDGVMRRGDKGWSLLYRTIFGHYMGHQSAGRTYSEVAGRLADLIEPVERMCLYYDADTNHCGCYDTRLIDRDALLELADEMQGELDECEDEHEIVGKLQYRIDRIREALGVER